MTTLPNSAEREIITQARFHEDLTIVAFHEDEGPLLELIVAPVGTGKRADLLVNTAEARDLAVELNRIADLALRAGWTPVILADARQQLPGMTDEQIIERLERLHRRLGGFVFGVAGRLGGRAARMLSVEVHIETLERAIALVDQHAEVLSGVPDVASRFRELRASLNDVNTMYKAELEHSR